MGLLIGLTGTYCAGKNHVAALLEKRGFPVLDVDKLGYEVIEAEREKILARFGGDLLREGRVDRKLLGARVFGKPGELAALEGIVHPAVNRLTLRWIEARDQAGGGASAGVRGAPPGACVINAALLHRSQVFGELGGIILVEAPLITRLLRAKKRDRLPWRALITRFRSQKNFVPQYFNGKTDIYRVENRGYSGFSSRARAGVLESRIDEILSLLGLSNKG
jgi:dephospho-CoA kinase